MCRARFRVRSDTVCGTVHTLLWSHTQMADFLDEKRREIQARMKELKPSVEEYELLQAADAALGGISNGTPKASAAAPAATAPARRTRRAAAGRGSGRRGRPRGGGTRAAQALELVRARPG